MQSLTITVAGMKTRQDARMIADTLRAAVNDPAAWVEVNFRTGAADVRTEDMRVTHEDLVAAVKHVRFDAR